MAVFRVRNTEFAKLRNNLDVIISFFGCIILRCVTNLVILFSPGLLSFYRCGFQCAVSVRFGDSDSQVVVRQYFLHFFGPFGKAIAAAVEIFFVAQIVSLADIFQSVEVKMIDGVAVAGGIFVDDGKGRAAHILSHTQLRAYLFDECGFAHAHLAEEGKETFLGKGGEKCFCHFRQCFYIGDFNFHV